MIEILSIFLQIFVILLFFLGPLNFKICKKFINHDIYIFDLLVFNTLLNTTILLFFSFYQINIYFIYSFIILLNLLSFLSSLRLTWSNFIFENNYKIFLFFIVCFLSLSFLMASDPKLTWDGIAHWYWKAMNYNQLGSFENLKNMPMAYYPHLGSYIWGFFWSINPINNEYYGRLFFIFVFLLPFFSASHRIKNIKIEILVLSILFLIFFTFDRFLIGGYQEYFLFFLFYSFSLTIFLNDKGQNKSLIIFSFLALLLMMWVKQEGLFYSIILTLILISFFKISKIYKIAFIILIILSIISMQEIRTIYHGSFSLNENIFHQNLLKYLDIRIFIETFYLITYEIFKGMVKYPIWLLILVLIIYDYFKGEKFLNLNNVLIILYIGLIYAIYFQTNMDIIMLMPLTLDRVLIHGSGFYLIFIFLKLNNLILISNK